MDRQRLAIEFGVYSEWLADAIRATEIDEPIAAACRGTGNPHLFSHLLGLLDPPAGARILDVGSGLGAPAAWLARATTCDVVGVDVMENNVRGTEVLFPQLPAVVATIEALPFVHGSFDAAWALGVLETVFDKRTVIREVARVLRRGGRLVVYSFVAIGEPRRVPLADRFLPAEDMLQEMHVEGLEVIHASPVPSLPAAPVAWRKMRDIVRRHIEDVHGRDPRWGLVKDQQDKIARLVSSDELAPWQFVFDKPEVT